MTSPRLMLAVDIGTSGARAVLFDARAHHLTQARKAYDTHFPQPGWSEQNPHAVAEAVVEVLREVVAASGAGRALAGIVLSAQMYSILALDQAGAPLSNSLTWADTRSARLAEEARRSASEALFLRTGCPVQAIYPLAKIRWLKANHDLPASARFASIKDYVVFRLTDAFVADWSMASASGLLDIARHVWDAEALALCGITAEQLPELVSPRHVFRRWRTDIADHIGIAADTPLIIGAGDAPLANIGAGAVGAGSLAINIGTSAAARVLTTQPQVDAAGRLWTYVADVDHWVMGGIIGSGGAAYEWLLKRLLFAHRHLPIDELFREADRLADGAPPGADGLLFIPYLSGEQSPGWKPESRGLIYGMTFQHEPGHFVRAAVEGAAFALLRVANAIAEVRNCPAEAIYLTGGLTASPTWTRTIASVFGVPVAVQHSPESSARGAAVLGWLALGAADSYDSFAHVGDTVPPDPALFPLYQDRFKAFCSLNDRLQSASGS